MNNDKLSNRLKTVGDFVPQNSRILDVGSDHAYLPINLLKNGKISYAIAGEVVDGPYQSAVANVKSQGLSDKIDVRLANGLEAFTEEDDIDTITIAGMGGSLISQILDAGKEKLHSIDNLVLQPNNSERNLRIWLQENGFSIVDEVILEENEKIYEVIFSKHGESNLNQTQIEFGPFLNQEKSPLFKKKWTRELEKQNKILRNLRENSQDSHRVKEIEAKIQFIEENL